MNCIIRKIEDSENEYFAYIKVNNFKASYFVYFHDDILGAVCLHNFIEMIKTQYQGHQIIITINEKEIVFKNDKIIELLRQDD